MAARYLPLATTRQTRRRGRGCGALKPVLSLHRAYGTHLYERLADEPEQAEPAARDAMYTRSAGGAGRGRRWGPKPGGGWGLGGTPI